VETPKTGKRKTWPKTITSGSVSVKVYEVNHATARTGKAYVLAWTTPAGRQTQKFADPDQAVNEGRLKADQMSAGRMEGASMTSGDRDELQAARRIAGTVPLLTALAEWQQAREITSGKFLVACEAWAARNGVSYETITTATVVTKFTAAKKKAGVDVKASYDKILPSLVTEFGERSLGSINSRELQAWLEKRYPHPVSRNTARKRIVSLWRWSRDQNYLPRDMKTEAEFTSTAQEDDGDIGVIGTQTFTELLHLFRKKHPGYLGALAVAGFCGLRRSEVHEQAWEDIDLTALHVRVTKAKRNTPAKRLVPISPAAANWFLLCGNRKGPMCTNLAIDRIRNIGRDAAFTLPDNCFRHSFISHRVAATGNVAETSLESGNSPRIIFQHYRSLFTKAQGEAWFSIPTEKQKSAGIVLDMQGKAAGS